MTSRSMGAVAAALALALAPGTAGAAELKFRGLLDVVVADHGPAYDLNLLARGDSPFDAYGLRWFADIQVEDRLQVFTQVVLRDASSPYVDGAYVMYTPSPLQDFHLQAGKLPWPIGTYKERTYSNHNPLIGAPLLYQYHTSLVWYEVPDTRDALLHASGSGQTGVNYEGYSMGRGMALVDDSYWDVGVTANGSARPLEYALGVTAGTPGWAATSRDDNAGKSVMGRLGAAPFPGLRVGVSGAYGPYLVEALNSELPAGRDANDYHQKLGMADLELDRGHVEIHAEGARNVWESPNVGALGVTGGYAEVKYALSFGAFLAGRLETLRFDAIADSTGKQRPWDSNVSRFETGLGYRFNRDAVAKIVYQQTSVTTEGALPRVRRPSLVAAQFSVGF